MKKQFAKLLSAFLAAAFMLAPMARQPAGAAEPSGAKSETGSMSDAEIMVYEIITEGIEHLVSEIDISGYAVFDTQKLNEIVSRAVENNPAFFYFEGKGNTTLSGGKVILINPSYIYTKSAITSMKAAFLRDAGGILAAVQHEWNDFEKALYIYEYLARQYVYDENSPYDDAYNLLRNGAGNALAYAKLSKYLLEKLGIDVRYARAGGYCFNAVSIDGKWYYFDPAQGGSVLGRGMVSLKTFLFSAAVAEPIYGGISCDVPCDTKKYDTAAWKEIYSGFAFAYDKWYFADTKEENGNVRGGLYSYDFAAEKKTKEERVTIDAFPVWGSESSVYTECFTVVCSNNGEIYYNAPEGVYAFDPRSGKTTEVLKLPAPAEGYLYGIKIAADKLYYKIEKTYGEKTDFNGVAPLSKMYEIRFTGENGTLQTQRLPYGKVIEGIPAPLKAGYNTAEWDFFTPGMTVTGDMTFRVAYANCFTYAFMGEDGEAVKSVTAPEGSYIIPPGNDPEKESSQTESYEFSHWAKFTDCMRLTKDIKFGAVFEKTDRPKITFSYLTQKWVFHVNKGDIIDSAPVPDPRNWSDEQYSYSYEGWEGFTPGIRAEGDLVFVMKVKKTPRRYTYQFINYNGDVFYSKTDDYGAVITAPAGKPSYSDNSGFTYTFDGWSGFQEGTILTGDKAFFATYTGVKDGIAPPKKFNITLYRDDGVLLASETVGENDELILVSGAEMDYEDLQYYYRFQSWQGYEKGMHVTGDAVFTAIYKKTPKFYSYVFLNNDETVIEEGKGMYGEDIPAPEDPAPQGDYPEMYRFTGFVYKIGEDICLYEKGMPLDGDYYFMATYEQAYSQCTLTFIGDDGAVLDTQTVEVLSKITGNLNEIFPMPNKEDENFSYVFEGWENFVPGMVVSKDITFVAKYRKIEKAPGEGRLPVLPEDSFWDTLFHDNMPYVFLGGGGILAIIVAVILAAAKGRKKKVSSNIENDGE